MIPTSAGTTDRSLTIAMMARCNSNSLEFLQTAHDSAGISGGISAACVSNTQLCIAEDRQAFIVATSFFFELRVLHPIILLRCKFEKHVN